MDVALIGTGAIGTFVRKAFNDAPHRLRATLVRPEKVMAGLDYVGSVDALPDGLDLVIDCAGHGALRDHGAAILARGIDVLSVSVGALADDALYSQLLSAAEHGNARLHLATGAIGALDCLQAARIGDLADVTYSARKPPMGWKGSPAEEVTALAALTSGSVTHFEGTAREAALRYPKNANVAAAVALAGAGFDATRVRLIADAEVTENIHEVSAKGKFGEFSFRIAGNALPDNPRSSALAAMSILSKLEQLTDRISL